MRVFLMIMIFAIGFGGYAAAAHSNDMGSCNPVQQSDVGCDHQNQDDAQNDASDKADNSVCPECTHCCAGHVGFYSPQPAIKILEQSAVLMPLPSQVITNSHVFSLLRPPKSIV